uniref:Cyclic nucleotide-binding domain-containing protein n=1 Tax=Globisporangium ultimum (strain ATCC 200006 / CBS 805.95 / DAOM BR144) TaxID=431595 RepID=K3WDZ6_GLOUD
MFLAHWECGLGSTHCQKYPLPQSWVLRDNLERGSMVRKYVRTLYWACKTVTTLGQGDLVPATNAETEYRIIIQFLSGLWATAILTAYSFFFSHKDANMATNISTRRQQAVQFLSTRKLPEELVANVRTYFQYMERTRNGVEEELILSNLPAHYRTQCLHYVKHKCFRRNRQGAFLRTVLNLLEKDFFAPNQVVLRIREAEDMFIVAAGEIRIMDEKSVVKGQLTTGNAYAEYALFEDHLSHNELITETYCELWYLTRRSFKKSARMLRVLGTGSAVMNKMVQKISRDASSEAKKTAAWRQPNSFFQLMLKTVMLEHGISTHIRLLVYIVAFVVPAVHFAGCLFFLVADIDVFHGGLPVEGVVPGIISTTRCLEDASLFGNCTWYMYDRSTFNIDAPYLRSLHWSLVLLSTVGYGDIAAFTTKECVAACIWIFLGANICYFTSAALSSVIAQLNILDTIHHERVEEINLVLMCMTTVSDQTKNTLRSYYETKWKLNGSAVHDEEVMPHLPRSLRRQVACSLFVENMKSNEAKRESKSPRYTLSPDALVARWWHRITGTILVYNFYMIIFRIVFLPYPSEKLMTWLTLVDYVFDGVLYLDIYLKHQHLGLYYLLGHMQLEYGIVEKSWINSDFILDQYPNDPLVHYMRAMYWCLSTFTVDCFGDVLAHNFLEVCFAGFTCILGWIFVGQVIGRINSLMITIDQDAKQRHERVEDFEQYSKQCNLPQSLRLRAMQSLAYKSECLLELKADDKLTIAQLEAIANVLYVEIYLHGDIIYEAGRAGAKLYIIKTGRAELFAPDSSIVYAAMETGTVFGEFSFFIPGATRLASSRAVRSCQVLQLDKKKWNQIWPREVRGQIESHLVPYVKAKYIETSKTYMNITKNFTTNTGKAISAAAPALQAVSYDPRLHQIPPWLYQQEDNGWDMLMLFITLYYIVVIPFRVGFLHQYMSDPTHAFAIEIWFVVEYLLTDTLCVVDFILHRNYFVFLRQGELVSDRQAITAEYWYRGSYVVDLMSIIPFEILAVVGVYATTPIITFSGHPPHTLWATLSLCRINRFLRGMHFHSLSDKVQHFILYDVKIGLPLRPSLLYVLRLALDFALGTHWVACLFFGISYLMYDPHRPSWLTAQGMLLFEGCQDFLEVARVPVAVAYLRSFHFSIGAITTVCYGDILPMNAIENVVTLAVIFISVAFFSMLSGGFFKFFERELGKRAEYEEKVAQVGHFMVFHQFPARTWKQMQVYFALSWQESKGMHEDQMLRGLTTTVRQEIALHVHANLFKHVKLFTHTEEELARVIIAALKHEIFVRNDVIIQRGDMGRSLYIIETGLVSICAIRNVYGTAPTTESKTGTTETHRSSVTEWMAQATISLADAQRMAYAGAIPNAISGDGGITGDARHVQNVAPVLDVLAGRAKGKKVTQREEKFVKGPFDYFGERSLLFGTPRNATCMALCVCSLFVLTTDRFEAILDEFPWYRAQCIRAWVMNRDLRAPTSK